MKQPYLFDEFFASGLEESVSPFLTASSRPWGKNLGLRGAGCAAFFLAAAFSFSFINLPLSYIFLSGVYFLSGAPALIATFNDLKNLEINIDVLMTLAAFLAVAIGSGLEGALLLVLFELSHGMEAAVSKKARSAIHNLNHLAPKFAHIQAEDGTLYKKSVREISVGMHLFVKNGEIVPLDGHVIEGASSVNLVHLTGESMPIAKKVGDSIAAGARNLESALVIEVTRVSADSTLTKIIQLITQAQEAKPKLQRWLDRFGKRYATSIICLTLIFALGLPLLFSMPYLGKEGGVYRALAFLIAASPCALIIATPTAYLSAISACARKGILLKGGITLDALASCRTIAFDKTGTLTTGDLTISSIDPLSKTSFPSILALSIAASLERHVVHPIATAICRFAEEKKAPLIPLEQIKAIPGSGIEAIALLDKGPTPVFIGLPQALGVNPEETKEGQVLAILAIGSEPEKGLFLFRFADQIRPDMLNILRSIQQTRDLKTVMLTGDNAHNAHAVGKLLGLDEIYADLRPQDKLDQIVKLSEKGGLAMVGDGINDAPALARATVGISMGRIGSATAVDASDVVLLNDDLHALGWLFDKSHQTLRIVKQNLTLALSVIATATIAALLGWIPLWIAVVLHEGGTVVVGLNSLRLLSNASKQPI
jgi:ATPase, P-type (transporting), HAD superfamily, subfamily IC/ATPase, P-type (transporting), HAD superfamily, subfamily IC/heavy metal translocating P-type ATPase